MPRRTRSASTEGYDLRVQRLRQAGHTGVLVGSLERRAEAPPAAGPCSALARCGRPSVMEVAKPPRRDIESPPRNLVRVMRLAVQRAMRNYEPGPAECLRRWFAAERTGASPLVIEYGYPEDPAFWVHGANTPEAVAIVFYGEPHPETMSVFGPVDVVALISELDQLGESKAFDDVFCEASMQLSVALHGERVFDSPPPKVGPTQLKSTGVDDDEEN